MTGEELSALIKDEIGEDKRLHAILDRIQSGKANLTDSELYAAITARITAQQMQRNVLSLDKREAAFVGIARERYTDTFTVFSAVQRILDAQNGIRIRPQEPGFDIGRARKIGHSLEDQTVPDSTIERRARSATENFCMSHHDDCMKVNAEFRARAGLQAYAIREGGAKCCDWCADVSGKYPASETPQGFWGRHDNCKCSILYESKRGGRQLLRGAKDNTRRWEVVPENAGAEPLVRLTKEQAMQIQQEKQLTVLTHEQALALQANRGLTIMSGFDRIEDDQFKGLFHRLFEHIRPTTSKNNSDNNEIEKFRTALYKIGFSKVYNSFFENVNVDMQRSIVEQLSVLERKYGAISKSFLSSISSEDTEGSVAKVRRNRANSAIQKLVLSTVDFYNREEHIVKRRKEMQEFYCMPCLNDDETLSRYVITHEYGHMLENILISADRKGSNYTHEELAALYRHQIEGIAAEIDESYKCELYLSKYGFKSDKDFFAECFANSQLGAPNVLGKAIHIWLERRGF